MLSPAQHSAVLCVITPGERQTLHTSHSHNQVILQTGPVYLCVTLRWWERSRGSYCSDWTVQPENIDSLISSASYNLISLISIMQRFMSLVMDVLIVRTGTSRSYCGMSSLFNIFLIFARRSRKWQSNKSNYAKKLKQCKFDKRNDPALMNELSQLWCLNTNISTTSFQILPNIPPVLGNLIFWNLCENYKRLDKGLFAACISWEVGTNITITITLVTN